MNELLQRVEDLIQRFIVLNKYLATLDNQLFLIEDIIAHNDISHKHILTLSPLSTVSFDPKITVDAIRSNLKTFLTYNNDIIPTDIDVKTRISTSLDARGNIINYTKIEQLTNKVYTLDIARYFVKSIPEGVINGTIVDAYLIDTNNKPIYPLKKPRQGIFTQQYIGYVKDDKLYIYPDYRNQRYKIRLRLWLNDLSADKYVLDESTFIVTEAYINASIYAYTENESINIRKFFNTIVPSDDIGYRVIPNLTISNDTIAIKGKIEVWIEAYSKSKDITIFRLNLIPLQ